MSDRQADLRVYDEASAPVLRWVRDLEDLLGAVAVAGLAWPDADLGADLVGLAARADGLGAEAGAVRLRELAVAVDAIRAAESATERSGLERQAFERLMALVGWERRFRVGMDRVAVQASLVVRGSSEGGATRRRGPVSDARLAVVGVELAGDRLGIHAVDLDSGAPFLLMDRLQEVNDADPMAKPAISRLFQDRLRLGDALAGQLLLSAHPVAVRGGVTVVRPAFDAAVVAHPTTGSARLALAPELGPTGWGDGPTRAVMGLGRDGERIRLEHAGVALPILETPVLRFVATKLALRGPGLAEVQATVRTRRGIPTLLAADSAQDGRCWPAVDPRAFPVPPSRLGSLLGGSLWGRATLRREDPELSREIAGSSPEGIGPAYRVGRAARAHGVSIPAAAAGWAAGTLADVGADGDDRWRAIWLILASERTEAHRPALQAVWDRAYASPPKDPTPGDLCARAALMDLLEVGATEEQSAADRAVGYLDAHLSALRLSARAREPRLPTLEALAWLAETRLMLTGEGGATPLTLVDLPPDRIRLVAIEAIWRTASTGLDADVAGDAVWALRLNGMIDQLL